MPILNHPNLLFPPGFGADGSGDPKSCAYLHVHPACTYTYAHEALTFPYVCTTACTTRDEVPIAFGTCGPRGPQWTHTRDSDLAFPHDAGVQLLGTSTEGAKGTPHVDLAGGATSTAGASCPGSYSRT